MNVLVKSLLIGALLALSFGAGAANNKTPQRIKQPITVTCGIAYSTCMLNGASPWTCENRRQDCLRGGGGLAPPRIGASGESPAQTLKDLSPDADFHAMQFQSLIASAGKPKAGGLRITPAMCNQWRIACREGRGDLRKCAQFQTLCTTP